jgi:hypothetical protein
MASQATYPLRMEAELDTGLSRWLWLVKWLLAIPHFIVLAFLWIAFVVLTAVALFAILFTGRYPRSIFEFNVGVLRWTWRVSYYAYGALGTDRYPPFTLEERADYPAHLEMAYSGRLSRGLVLVKWWLLAIPHYIVVGILIGGTTWYAAGHWGLPFAGLIGILVVVAGVILAFTGQYPRSLFDLILGLNRWVLRVAAYTGLMTDQYPPFRLDMGGAEPGTLTIPQPPGGGPSGFASPSRPDLAPGRRPGWTGGRITSLVIGILLGLVSFGLLAGGGFSLWADQTQRDAAGFVTMVRHDYSTPTHALTSERIDVGTAYGFFPRGVLDRVRVTVTSNVSGRPVFVGIGPASEVGRYLSGVDHSVVTDLGRPGYRTVAGERSPAPPSTRGIWTVASVGRGPQTVVWRVAEGSWTLVVMNADGSGGVDIHGALAATVPDLLWIAVGLLAAGGMFLVLSMFLVVVPIRRASKGVAGHADHS